MCQNANKWANKRLLKYGGNNNEIIKSEGLLRVTPPKNKKNKKLRERVGAVGAVGDRGGVGCLAPTGGKRYKDKDERRATH